MSTADLTDYDGIAGATFGPDGTLAYIGDSSGRDQVWLRRDGKARHLPTPGTVRRIEWHPDGRTLLVLTDPDGTEAHGLAELDIATGTLREVVGGAGVRCEVGVPYSACGRAYSRDGTLLAYATTARDPEVYDVYVREAGVHRMVLRGDDRYFPMSFAPDGTRLLVLRLHQNTEHDLFVVDLATGATRHLTPHDGPAKYEPVGWAPDGRSVYLCTTQGRDHLGFARWYLDGTVEWIATPENDVEQAAVWPDGRTLAWTESHDGWTVLQVARDGAPPQRCSALPDGVAAMEFGHDGHLLAVAPDGRLLVLLGRPDTASELFAVDVATDTAEQLTEAGARLPGGLVVPEVVHTTSRDGVRVSSLLYRPAGASADRPVPVVMTVHGGPEAQSVPVYDPLVQTLLARGIGVVAPNFRGSSGYGMRYQRLVYRDWGGGDLADLAAVAEHVADLDWVDGDRLGVHGASYGGFAALSCLSRLPGLWRAGVSECGPSDLVTDAATMPPTWRRRTTGWIGDPDDPEDRARLRERSPLEHAADVRAPVLLLHGENDTRVDPRESEQMYRRLTDLGREVRLDLHPGLGHDSGRAGRSASVDLVADWFGEHL